MKRPSHYKWRGTTITTMRLTDDVVRAAKDRARDLGVSRTQYVERVLRADLGMEQLDAENESVFG